MRKSHMIIHGKANGAFQVRSDEGTKSVNSLSLMVKAWMERADKSAN
jgi:hypothetical protein